MTNERSADHGAAPHVLAGRYEIGPLIGRGATARVHRALDRELGRAVAVKVYDVRAVDGEHLRRAREKTVLASIHHPRVVTLFDSGTDGDRPYLVMQLVDGENLAERLLAGPFTAAQVSELGVRLADALAHVHARQIVHRDLKPANVLLGPDGPLITDFGIAHELDSTHITGTGLVTGTAAYLAPEQILGERPGPPADVYALGLILLECLTARREFPGTLAESALARLHRAPRIPDGTPAPLAHALSRMTAREPADRPDAGELPGLLGEDSATVVGAAGRSEAGELPGLLGERSAAVTAAVDGSGAGELPGLLGEDSATVIAAVDGSGAGELPGLLSERSAAVTAVVDGSDAGELPGLLGENSAVAAAADRPEAGELSGSLGEDSATVVGAVGRSEVGEWPGLLGEDSATVAAAAGRSEAGEWPGLLGERSAAVTAAVDRPGAEQLPRLLGEDSATVTAAAVPAAATARRRTLAAAGVLAAAAAVLAVVLTRPADPGSAPARLPEAAPPTGSAAAPSPVTLSPASAVMVVSSQAVKPVTQGVVAAVPQKRGPAKPGGGPHPGAGKPGGPGRR
ncbi:protein kinase [Amycolatopsis sp. NPDC049252]|uniref:serine/threonine-protein kinase n=1 Tax=Amycolatopsis sp. NPDC049252 TaxID=3363933 RepID=UPI003713CF09